jgi:putative alpha-1,2-mannosidase
MLRRQQKNVLNQHRCEKIKIKFALSGVSTVICIKKYERGNSHWDFERTMKRSSRKWEKELSKIHEAPEDTKVLYTGLCIIPFSNHHFMDVDGNWLDWIIIYMKRRTKTHKTLTTFCSR